MKENKAVIKIVICDIIFVIFSIFTHIELFSLITIGLALVLLNILMLVNVRVHAGKEIDLKEHKIIGFLYGFAIVMAVAGIGKMLF